jgi:hypothetical protein
MEGKAASMARGCRLSGRNPAAGWKGGDPDQLARQPGLQWPGLLAVAEEPASQRVCFVPVKCKFL